MSGHGLRRPDGTYVQRCPACQAAATDAEDLGRVPQPVRAGVVARGRLRYCPQHANQ